MFIREAAEYVNLKVGQLRKYVAEGYIEYHHSKVENYYDYNVDDLNDLKIYLNIIENYKNFNFDIEIPDRIYSKFKEYIDHNYVLNIYKIKKEYTLEEYLKHKKYFDKKRGLMVKLRCKECNSIKYIDTAIMKDITDYDNYMCKDCRDEKAKQERKLIRNMKRYLNLSFRKMVEAKRRLEKVGTKDNPMEWDYYINHKAEFSKSSKKWVKIICQECHKEAEIQIRKFENRKYATGLPICSNCICKYTTSLSEWREVNSKAQLIAQNRPEVKEKMRKAVKLATNTPEMRKLRKINAKKLWENTEYAEKIIFGNNKFLKGFYDGIKFDSSWELSFIIRFKNHIERCKFGIKYKYKNEYHTYYPDFILKLGNYNILIEIKGQDSDVVKEKEKAAIEFIKHNDYLTHYKVLYMEDLLRINNFVFYNSIEKLNKLNQEKLKIISYPKTWIKNQNLEE